jgi:acyl-CoA dehydrogenase
VQRNVYDEDQQAFGEMVASFLRTDAVPHYGEWEKVGHAPRQFLLRAGELGLLGMQIPETFGGGGVSTFRFNAMLTEQSALAGLSLGILRVHADLCLPYFLRYCTKEQKKRWLPGMASGELLCAIAMSEPVTGSDLAGIKTTAVRDGDIYRVNGAKTFITNGSNADLVITAVKTDPDTAERHRGISLLVIERGMPGFHRGRNLEKLGMKATDTAELFFDDVAVPVENVLGEEGHGWDYLMSNLAQERLSIAISAQGAAVRAVGRTVSYVNERRAFGTPIGSFQNTRFSLADCATEIAAGQALIDQAIEAHDHSALTASDAAMVKLYCTEMQNRTVDRCLQLHGGYGYMMEQEIARAFADARVTRIYGGSSEIMKTIIAKAIGLV